MTEALTLLLSKWHVRWNKGSAASVAFGVIQGINDFAVS